MILELWNFFILLITYRYDFYVKSKRVIKIMDQKQKELKKYSDFEKVKKIAEKMGLNPVGISTRKDKKYMIMDNNGDVKHFGLMGYQDFTKTRDMFKRNNFRNRNWKWEHADKYSPAWLSFHLLW
jgi:bifunctional DNA-binding transcriptional regulator/antitoxin component of YhaV-PrlF toxin-antitoxin module